MLNQQTIHHADDLLQSASNHELILIAACSNENMRRQIEQELDRRRSTVRNDRRQAA